MSTAIENAIRKRLKAAETSKRGNDVMSVNLKALKDNPYQPRLEYEQKYLDELAHSIKENGLLQHIVVGRIKGEEQLYIIAGHRRKRACELLGYEKIDAKDIGEVCEDDLLICALEENTKRRNLSLIEEALSYEAMLKKNIKLKDIATRTGQTEASVSRKKNILKLHPEIVEDISVNKSTSDINALSTLRRVKDSQKQLLLYKGFLQNGRGWLDDEVKIYFGSDVDNKNDIKRIDFLKGLLEYLEYEYKDSDELERKIKKYISKFFQE